MSTGRTAIDQGAYDVRRCFIHIGTHKTGTTSIQHMLRRGSPALATLGYWYPRAGRLEDHPGHHNIAWEISSDHRFRTRFGTTDDLLREVHNRSEDIILSSEDFQSALHHRARFSDFISRLQSCGFAVTVILYTRAQSEYLARIYLSLLLFGLELPFDAVLQPVLDQAVFRWREWVLNFDYADLFDRLGALADVGVIARSYGRAHTSICADFLSIFNMTLRDVSIGGELSENRSWPLRDYLQVFLTNRRRRAPLAHEQRVVTQLVSPAARAIHLSPGVTRKLVERYRDSNRRVVVQYGISEPALALPDDTRAGDSDLSVDELFSERTEAAVLATVTT